MEVLILAILFGLIPAVMARSKGRSFFGFWIYGALIFIVALPHAILARPNEAALDARRLASGANRKCPHCAEVIKMEAWVCRFCGRDVAPTNASSASILPADRATPPARGLRDAKGWPD